MSVKYELDGEIAVVTLNRPESFNAITAELSAELVDALARAGNEARAAVVTGAGKAFCAGADLEEIAASYEESGPDLGSILDEHFHPAINSLVNASIPTVASLNGVAAGAGLGLALACDLRVMSKASFMISAFAGIGLTPDSGTTWSLPHHVGVSKALEITLTNRKVDAEEAHRLGLCLEVVEADDLLDTAKNLAKKLAELVPDSLVTTRHLVRNASSIGFEEALADERREQHRLGQTPEHAEGVNAFLEKRKPDYRRSRD